MSPAADVDELFDVKNNFFIGNFQGCINESQKLKVDNELRLERDIYLYRAYLAQKKYRVVIDEIHGASPKDLQTVKLFAEYMSHPNKREEILKIVDEISTNQTSDVNALIIASIYVHEQNYDSALRVLFNADDLECSALALLIYLKTDRLDLAKKEFKVMQEKDDDATITQLCQAWINLFTGGEKLQEAYYIYQELMDKYNATPLLLNGQATSFLGQQKYEEAEAALQEAQDKDPNDVDTLINLIVLSSQTGKPPEVVNRYISQLKDSHAAHPYVKDFLAKENEFDRLCRSYCPS